MANYKLKNNNFFDSKGITHNNKLLSDILDRVDVLHCKQQYTGSNTYTDFNLKYDIYNEFDRRVYFYMAVGNGATLYAGLFTYNNGTIAEQKSLTDRQASVTANEDHTIRITIGNNWAYIMLISTFPM